MGRTLSILGKVIAGDAEQDQLFVVGSRGNPAISGDGRTVVFASNSNFTRQNADQGEELFAVGTDGSGLRQLTNTTNVSAPNIGDVQTTQAALSPTLDYRGSRVGFFLTDDRIRRTEGGGERVSFDISLYPVNADSGGQRRLSSVSDNFAVQEALGERPSISGDGNTLAFPAFLNLAGGNPDGGLEVFTVKWDGTGLRQATNSSGRSAFPSLNYDGSRVVFTQFEAQVFERMRYEVYPANADGTGLTQLTSTPGDPVTSRSGYEGVAISPDGSHVIFSSSGITRYRPGAIQFHRAVARCCIHHDGAHRDYPHDRIHS